MFSIDAASNQIIHTRQLTVPPNLEADSMKSFFNASLALNPILKFLPPAACAAFLLAALPGQAAERQAVHYHLPPAVTSSAPVARSAGWKRLKLAIGLPLRHQEDLDKLLREVSDPASPNFR